MALSTAATQRGLFLFLCLVWGTNWLAMKAGTAEVPPGIYSGLRWTVAGAVLLIFLALRGDPVRVPPRLWGRINRALAPAQLITASRTLVVPWAPPRRFSRSKAATKSLMP